MQPVDRERVRAEEAFLHRVQRRRADIAIDDADRAQHQLGQRFLGPVMIAGFGGGQDIVCANVVHHRHVAPSRIKFPCGFWVGPEREGH